jgi:hypothetical protein
MHMAYEPKHASGNVIMWPDGYQPRHASEQEK